MDVAEQRWRDLRDGALTELLPARTERSAREQMFQQNDRK
jgi:hypothetical protein